MRWRWGIAALLAATLAAAPAHAAKPAKLSGTVVGTSIPKAGHGVAAVRALDLRTLRVADADRADRRGRYDLKVPGGRYALVSSVVRAGQPLVRAVGGLVRARSGQTIRSLRVSPKRRKHRRKRRAAQGANINPRDGWEYAGVAVGVRYFTGGRGDAAVMNKGLADMIVTDLVAGSGSAGCEWTVVEIERRAEIVAEIERQQDPRFDPDSAVRPGHLIDPEYHVDGQITVTGDGPGAVLRVDSQITEVKTGVVRARVTTTDRGADFFAAEVRLVALLKHWLCEIQKPPAPSCSAPTPGTELSLRFAHAAQACITPPPAPPPSPPDDPNAGSAGYNASFSGTVDIAGPGHNKASWTGTVVLGLTRVEAGGIPLFPPGSYGIYRVRSGSADVEISGDDDATCSYTGTAHITMRSEAQGNPDQLAVQLKTATPAYAVAISSGSPAMVPVTWTGPPDDHCDENSETVFFLPPWVYSGTTPLIAASRTLDATVPISSPSVYSGTNTWHFLPG